MLGACTIAGTIPPAMHEISMLLPLLPHDRDRVIKRKHHQDDRKHSTNPPPNQEAQRTVPKPTIDRPQPYRHPQHRKKQKSSQKFPAGFPVTQDCQCDSFAAFPIRWRVLHPDSLLIFTRHSKPIIKFPNSCALKAQSPIKRKSPRRGNADP